MELGTTVAQVQSLLRDVTVVAQRFADRPIPTSAAFMFDVMLAQARHYVAADTLVHISPCQFTWRGRKGGARSARPSYGDLLQRLGQLDAALASVVSWGRSPDDNYIPGMGFHAILESRKQESS